MADLTRAELIERLEALSGPDREMDEAILAHLGIHAWAGRMSYRDGPMWIYFGHSNITASIDAAVALVEKVLSDARYDLSTTGMRPGATVISYERRSREGAYAATAPIAILTALLRALDAKEGRQG